MNRLFPKNASGLLALICIFHGTIVQADLLVLKNGDRITGDIKRIWDGEVLIEPEYADEFELDLAVVEYIESDEEFEIDLEDGRSIVAALAGADADGNQIVKSGDDSISVPVEELFELDEIEARFDWSSNVEASATLNRGNTDTTNTMVRADGMIRFNDHRHLGELAFFREDLAGVRTKEQDLFKYSYNFLFKEPWFFSADLSFERDAIIELDSRVIISAGIGRDIWDTPRRTLNVRLGAGFQQEEIMSNTTDSSVATWTLRYRQDFFSEDVGLFHNQTITTNLTGRTNTSYRTSTGLGYEISDLLTTNITLNYDYETAPIDVASNEDIALLFGLVLEFE